MGHTNFGSRAAAVKRSQTTTMAESKLVRITKEEFGRYSVFVEDLHVYEYFPPSERRAQMISSKITSLEKAIRSWEAAKAKLKGEIMDGLRGLNVVGPKYIGIIRTVENESGSIHVKAVELDIGASIRS